MRTVLIAALLFVPMTARGEGASLDTKLSVARTHEPPELDRRLAFLDEALEGPALHANLWWWGWLSFYVLGTAAQGTRLALVDGDAEDASTQRADFIISIVKSVAGIVSLLVQPLSARDGADAMRAIEGDTIEAKVERLVVGEATLEANAKEAERRYSILRHSLLLLINLAHGAIIWLAFDDLQTGLISTGLGLGFGQIIYWTQPWQPISDLEAYRAFESAH